MTQQLAEDCPEFAIVEDKRTVKVFYSSGDVITKQLDGTNDEIVASHLGKPFGDSAHIAMCVQIDDKYKQGLMVRNIENDETGRVKSVRRQVVKIDDNKSFEEIVLTLYSGLECALNDVWVYDMKGEWLNAIGYRKETVKR